MSPRSRQTHVTGVILAGTHPWTNAPFDSLMPRTLLPVAHRPLIWYGLSWLHREGIYDVAVCGNRDTRILQERLERHVPHGMTVSYHEDPMPRGAAGSARDAGLATDAQTIVVIDGTVIPAVDLGDVLERHNTSGAWLTVVTHSEARRNGNPALQVPSGVYVFDRRALAAVPERGFCDIKEKLIPQLYEAGQRIVAFEAESTTPRVLDASTYLAVNEWMVDQLVGTGRERDGYLTSPHGLVHRDAFIAEDASIVGPIMVGPGARILSGAVVIGPTSIGREAVIESGAVVSRSAVWRRSRICESATTDRCIVADDAVIASNAQMFRGVVVSNRRSEAAIDWVSQQTTHIPKVSPAEVGAKLSRLLFGTGWSRSPAAQ